MDEVKIATLNASTNTDGVKVEGASEDVQGEI